MNTYVLSIDNGMSYPDSDHDIEAVFDTYRGASEYVMHMNFIPAAGYSVRYEKWELEFEEKELITGNDNKRMAWISEYKVKD